MKKIDIDFNNLIWEINNRSKEEIFNHIKENYEKLNSSTIASIEIFLAQFGYWGKLNLVSGEFEELERRSSILKSHTFDLMWLYDNLGDYRSKIVLFGILNYWYNSLFDTLDMAIEKNYHQYFDLDLINCDNSEVFVDIGAYTGDTILDYINTYREYKSIYAYEITPSSIDYIKQNLSIYPNIYIRNNAATDKSETLYIKNNSVSDSANTLDDSGELQVQGITIDDDVLEKVTMIKMDIEGSELKALKGCVNHIKNDTPKLLISVYHKHGDIIDIPKFIYNTNPNYKFYLRYFGNKFYPTETVLLAIPK